MTKQKVIPVLLRISDNRLDSGLRKPISISGVDGIVSCTLPLVVITRDRLVPDPGGRPRPRLPPPPLPVRCLWRPVINGVNRPTPALPIKKNYHHKLYFHGFFLEKKRKNTNQLHQRYCHRQRQATHRLMFRRNEIHFETTVKTNLSFCNLEVWKRIIAVYF